MRPSFVTHNDLEIAGTSYVGCVEASYATLVEAFGEPLDSQTLLPDGKTDVLWTILFARKRLATVYNWKDGPNYLGAKGTPIPLIRTWHVGACQKEMVRLIAEVLGLREETKDLMGFTLFR